MKFVVGDIIIPKREARGRAIAKKAKILNIQIDDNGICHFFVHIFENFLGNKVSFNSTINSCNYEVLCHSSLKKSFDI